MRHERLRDRLSAEEMATVYATPHDHRLYGRGHGERVAETARMGVEHGPWASVADLSCGNAVIARALHDNPILGDFAPGYQLQGPIESTVELIAPVGLFVLSETLEHVDDPMGVLRRVAAKAGALLLSTPIECWGDTNTEHCWAYDQEWVSGAIRGAGFGDIVATSIVDSTAYGEPYRYFIALARK